MIKSTAQQNGDVPVTIGQTFGELSVISLVRKERVSGGYFEFYWLCRCSCGDEKVVTGRALRGNPGVRSCGCSRRRPYEYGYCSAGSEQYKTYQIWVSTLQGCDGSDIKVCSRWQGPEGFEHFLSDMGPRPSGATLKRRNREKNYDSDNCFWCVQPGRDTAQGRKLCYRGEHKTLAEWSRELRISHATLRTRIYRLGWSVQRALDTPVRPKRPSRK